METIRGIITSKSVENGTAKSTGKPYTRCVFKINDKDYSTFDKEIYENFDINDDVNVTLQKKGEYMNMLSMSKLASVTSTKPENVQPEASDRQIQLLEEILAVLKENGNSTK